MGETWTSKYATHKDPHPEFKNWEPTAEDPLCSECGAPKHRHLGGQLCGPAVPVTDTKADEK